VRSLLSCKSEDVHVVQSQAITGTPWEVPVPRKVIFTVEIFPDKPILKISNRQLVSPFFIIRCTTVYLLYLNVKIYNCERKDLPHTSNPGG